MIPNEPFERQQASELSDLLLARLTALAARARRFGMSVTVGQMATLVDALGACPVDAVPELKRLVRLTLATRTADLGVLDAIVDTVFGPSLTTDSGPRPSALTLTTDEIRALLRSALEAGDLAGAIEIGALAAALEDGEPAGGAGRAGQRILRALDLSELLSRALALHEVASDLERRLGRAEAEGTLEAFEIALQGELRRRMDRARRDDGSTSSRERHALRGIVEDLPLLTTARSEQDQLRAALRPLVRRLAARARRRRRRGHDHLDIRRTLARSVGTGGVPMTLHVRGHRPRLPRLVVLADVSGSMADYSRFTLSLLEAMRHELASLRCFAFVDGAAELTGEMLRQPFLLAPSLPFIPGVISGDGHSDYEAALEAFVEVAGDALTAATTLIVIGDGRTRRGGLGEGTLSDVRRRVKCIYWITPEPPALWGSGDCSLERYQRHCDRIDQVSTLAQLDRWVDQIALQA
jgi:uncharacterized protein with von Willebrand factor type A (vWA) domain